MMKPASRVSWYVASTWLILLGGYISIFELVPAGAGRTAAANILLCLLPLLVNGALLINAVTPDLRKKAFWMLLALGSSLWMVGQIFWTYAEVHQHRNDPSLFNGDIVFFLHAISMIAALTVQPHRRPDDRKIAFEYVDFGLLLCWWIYLYIFIVIPWQYVVADNVRYVQSFSIILVLENVVFIGGAIALIIHAKGYWRRIYAHLAGARAIYAIRFLAIELTVGSRTYSRGSLYDLPLLISFLWLARLASLLTGMAGRRRNSPQWQ
jgi:hypothetical protein